MSGDARFPCRTCGGPGRLYMSGRWCDLCSPHPVQPTPPPHQLVPTMSPKPPERPRPTDDPREDPVAPVSARGAALVARVAGLAERAPRTVGDPYVRDGQRSTSFAAAVKALPKSGTQRGRVLAAIVEAAQRGYLGATDPELMRHLDLPGNSLRPRRGELVEQGLVEPSGHERSHDGNAHIVWCPTSAALAALHLAPTPQG